MPSTIASTAPAAARSAPVVGGEVYLIGRRGSPHVPEYRDFLERNLVAFRWIDVDRNPLVRFLEASGALRRGRLPFFLFPDGTTLEVPVRRDAEEVGWRAPARRWRSASGCTRSRCAPTTTW